MTTEKKDRPLTLYLFRGTIFGKPETCVGWHYSREEALKAIQYHSPNFKCEPSETEAGWDCVIPLITPDDISEWNGAAPPQPITVLA